MYRSIIVCTLDDGDICGDREVSEVNGEDFTKNNFHLLGYDLDENWQTRFWKRILQEKDEKQRRLRLIQHHEGLLEKQRQGLMELKQSLDKQSADIKTQKIELKEIEPLIPQLRELKNAGVDFTLLMQIVATLNESAIFQNVNLNVAARNVAQEIRLCRELGGVKQAVEMARHQLSTMESLIQNQNNGVQPHVNVNNGYGLTVDSYAKLAIARGAMVKMLNNTDIFSARS